MNASQEEPSYRPEDSRRGPTMRPPTPTPTPTPVPVPGRAVPEPGQAVARPGPQAGPPAPPTGRVARAFDPPEGMVWARVSPLLTWHRRVVVVLWGVPVGVIGGVLLGYGPGTPTALLWGAAVLVGCALGWFIAGLNYRSWGFAERAEDLLVTHGVFVKRLVVVPYGRMQFVDVTSGLLERWLGIATVRLNTAAAATDAHIPGLAAHDAAILRDRLAQKGEARSMGL